MDDTRHETAGASRYFGDLAGNLTFQCQGLLHVAFTESYKQSRNKWNRYSTVISANKYAGIYVTSVQRVVVEVTVGIEFLVRAKNAQHACKYG